MATILYEATEGEGHSPFQVIGVGLWNLLDDVELRNMLLPKNNVGRTLFRLSPDASPEYKPVTAQLYNLLDTNWTKKTNQRSTVEPDISTNRVIRIYGRTGDHVKLTHRIDWELELSEDTRGRVQKRIDQHLTSHLGLLKGRHRNLRHIVVKDLGKGVVTASLVSALKDVFPDAMWYVSSKARDREWLKALPTDNVRLLLVPQQAVATSDRQASPWLISGSHPSNDALDSLQGWAREFRNARIVVLPRDLSLLTKASAAVGGKEFVVVQSDIGSLEAQQFVPMASVFFPALVANRVASENAEAPFLEEVRSSLNFTYQWMIDEGKRLKQEDWIPEGQKLKLRSGNATNGIAHTNFGTWHQWPWNSEVDQWKQAFKDCGIIDNEGKMEFHLWRAMIEVPGYVAWVTSKRKQLRTLLKYGREFVLTRPRRAMSFMLIDAPGSGKTFLIKRLAKALAMRSLTFNITQMLTRNNLLHCFDTIATAQAQDPEEPMLVFIDEINSKLDGQHVYDSFLAPLEEGVYVRSGNTFHIPPCFWIFAGTEQPVPSEKAAAHDKSDKGSDFESRLTEKPLVLVAENSDEKELRMEKVYVGVASIRAEFPDVQRISDKVLRAFRILDPATGPRDIRHFVKQFQHIQFASVRQTNLPDNWHAVFHDNLAIDGEMLEQWRVLKEGSPLVDIKGESGI